MELKLTNDDADLLRRMLAQSLGELRHEITKTENYDWRQSLKQDEVRLKAILEQLGHREEPAKAS
jgi:hypothetical protein